MNSYVDDYNKNGFVRVPKLVSDRARQRLFETLIRVFQKYNPAVPLAELEALSWDDQRLSDLLIQFRAKSPTLFGAMYDSLQTCVALN